MSKVLIVNHAKGYRCGVHDYGVRFFEGIRESTAHEVWYTDADSLDDYLALCESLDIDVAFFNWMSFLMPWADEGIRRARAIPVVLQHLYDDASLPAIMSSYRQFDRMAVLDPSVAVSDPRIHVLGRPIPRHTVAPRALGEHVQIGSMGFGLGHKGFDTIAREVNRCFDHATFNLHMTVGDFTGNYADQIIASVEAELTKPDVTLNWTPDYVPDSVLVERLAGNDMNALFYTLPPDMVGRSSAVDYMVAAQRPLLLTDCASFQHVHHGTYQYPTVSFDTIAGNWEWCQNHSFELYERQAGQLLPTFDKMMEAL